ncbi:MAG: SulP family inorganic anion transporter, partial [Cyanobacteria bacterium SZAS LIN-2]|nr:SulP family inorganic anion transporter [Cyanobacteria bacterium SZAS LIN-2]
MSNPGSTLPFSGQLQYGLPKDGIAGLKENWKQDIVSGFILFLIALPLSLAIAIASGMPPMAGIFAAIIGGLVVSQLSGSFVTINGPAAGLIVVVVHAVDKLGGGSEGYHGTLAVIVISGVLLLIMGLCKAGELSKFFPSSVVHGMLASIGITIMLKQFPHMLGVAPPAKEPVELLMATPFTVTHLNPEIAVIGGVSLLILIALTFVKKGIIKKVPPPIIVVMVACLIGAVIHINQAHSYVAFGQVFDIVPKKLLVQLPTNFASSFSGPDWAAIAKDGFWACVLSVTLVQGIETVLSCSAVDKLDPFKRQANTSRDLAAVGLGTVVSGMIGGLPMIAEIVRSTANIANGARTRWSNFFHGLFILIFVSCFAALVNNIPMASLAALLCFTGYRLASPRVFKEAYEIGWEQLLVFCTTTITALFTDLLIGVAAGVAVKFLLHLLRGVPVGQLFNPDVTVTEEGENTV